MFVKCVAGTECLDYMCEGVCQATCFNNSLIVDPPPLPPDWPYRCLEPAGAPAHKCWSRGVQDCHLACPRGQFSAPFNCTGTCECQCIEDLNISPGKCSKTGQPAKFCEPKDEEGKSCDGDSCSRGEMCELAK
jgi:hypothetical protein